MLLNYIAEQCHKKHVAIVNIRDRKILVAPPINVTIALREFLESTPLLILLDEIKQFMLVDGGFHKAFNFQDFLRKKYANLSCIFSTQYPFKLLGVTRYSDLEGVIDIHEIATSFEQRRNGLGKLLMLYVINHVRLMEVNCISLINNPSYIPELRDILKSLTQPPLDIYKFKVTMADEFYDCVESRGNFYSQLGFTGEAFMTLKLPANLREFQALFEAYAPLRRSVSYPDLAQLRPLDIKK